MPAREGVDRVTCIGRAVRIATDTASMRGSDTDTQLREAEI